MKITADYYIDTRLAELDSYQKTFSELFYFLEEEELFFIPEDESWCAIEVIEHLNNFAEHYLPQWTAICKAEYAREKPNFRLSWTAKKLRQWMEGDPRPGSLMNRVPRGFEPRRLRDENLKISPQKMMENFLSDMDQLRRILKVIPHSKELRKARVKLANSALSMPAITALELYIPHIGRHLKQADRILSGGREALAARRKAAEENRLPDSE